MVDQSSISLPTKVLDEVKKFIENDPFYSSNAEFIKWAIKEKLEGEKNKTLNKTNKNERIIQNKDLNRLINSSEQLSYDDLLEEIYSLKEEIHNLKRTIKNKEYNRHNLLDE